jgi:hypothetical protein
MPATFLSRNVFSSHILSENVVIGIYKTIIFAVVFYLSKAWSLTSREEHRPRVLGNGALRSILFTKYN